MVYTFEPYDDTFTELLYINKILLSRLGCHQILAYLSYHETAWATDLIRIFMKNDYPGESTAYLYIRLLVGHRLISKELQGGPPYSITDLGRKILNLSQAMFIELEKK